MRVSRGRPAGSRHGADRHLRGAGRRLQRGAVIRCASGWRRRPHLRASASGIRRRLGRQRQPLNSTRCNTPLPILAIYHCLDPSFQGSLRAASVSHPDGPRRPKRQAQAVAGSAAGAGDRRPHTALHLPRSPRRACWWCSASSCLRSCSWTWSSRSARWAAAWKSVSARTLSLTLLTYVPRLILETLPFFAMLVGSILTFSRLSRRSEIPAIRAAGVSAWRFLGPAIALGLLTGIVMVAILDPLATKDTLEFEDKRAALLDTRSTMRRRICATASGLSQGDADSLDKSKPGDQQGRAIISAKRLVGRAEALEDVTFYYFKQDAGRRSGIRLPDRRQARQAYPWVLAARSGVIEKPAERRGPPRRYAGSPNQPAAGHPAGRASHPRKRSPSGTCRSSSSRPAMRGLKSTSMF